MLRLKLNENRKFSKLTCSAGLFEPCVRYQKVKLILKNLKFPDFPSTSGEPKIYLYLTDSKIFRCFEKLWLWIVHFCNLSPNEQDYDTPWRYYRSVSILYINLVWFPLEMQFAVLNIARKYFFSAQIFSRFFFQLRICPYFALVE